MSEGGRRRRSGGRAARQAGRAAREAMAASPFLTRALAPVEVLSTEGLETDRGQRRDDPGAGRGRVRRVPAGPRAPGRCRGRGRWRAGPVPPRPVSQPRDRHRASQLRPACPQPRTVGDDRWRRHRVRPQLRVAVRVRSRRGPTLRQPGGLRELREAGLPGTGHPPLGRHGVRTGRRPGQQAPSRHGLRPSALERQAPDGIGDRRRAGSTTRSSWPGSPSAGTSATGRP